MLLIEITEDDLMPAPIPIPVRQVILQRWCKGESVASLAEELRLAVRTVRHLVRRFAERGQNALEPDYARCATKKLPTHTEPFRKAIEMRQQHPRWGGGLIRVFLQEKGARDCPSERTLQRWFRRCTLASAPPGRRPAGKTQRAQQPHDVWQMDAVDQLRLASGQQVSWLRLVDECSGAVLQTTIFPPSLLGLGRAHAGAGDVAPGFFAVGTAPAFARRQRHSLGIEGRLAHRPGAVADRPGGGDALESSPVSPRQWRGRTLARHRETLDRAQHLQGCGGTAAADDPDGPHPAGSLSKRCRAEPLASISGSAARRSTLQQDLGERPLESRLRFEPPGGIQRGTARG
jgi:transposase